MTINTLAIKSLTAGGENTSPVSSGKCGPKTNGCNINNSATIAMAIFVIHLFFIFQKKVKVRFCIIKISGLIVTIKLNIVA
jgi:hypothetical protein